MTVSGNNPFICGRREQEDQKDFDIFVPHSDSTLDFFKWISGQQFLFLGTRGSGKTSLLQSMEWPKAWIKNKIGKVKGSKEIEKYFNSDSVPRHLGVLFRCDLMDNEVWIDWSKIHGEKYAQRIFALYLEYSFLYLFLNALSKIIIEKPELFAEDWIREESITSEILNMAFPELQKRPKLFKNTFYELSYVFRDITGMIRSQLTKETPYDFIVENLNFDDAGKLIQLLGEKIIEIPKLNETLIFPMIDDCDRLSNWQSNVVGSFIFRAKHPVSYKLTSMVNREKISYTADNRPLTEHELTRVAISGSTETEWETNKLFYNQFNGILQTRINHFYKDIDSNLFSLKKLLGNPSLDELVTRVIERSQSKGAIGFYNSYKSYCTKNKDKSIINYFMKINNISDEKYYSLYKESINDKKMVIRKNYTHLNKKRQVTAIAMLKSKELEDINYPYAGTSVVLKLCCGSIRELLRVMFELWKEAGLPIEKFLEKENISFELQNKAIRSASESYWKSIVGFKALLNTEWDINKTKYTPTSPVLICERLGNLFSIMQSLPYICKSHETGSLEIEVFSEGIEHILDYLLMAGVLIKKTLRKRKVKIALHPFFAPKFNLSPRHPFYYSKSMSNSDFEILIGGSDDIFNKKILLSDTIQLNFNLGS